MKIAAELFERLLRSDDPEAAVSQLDRFWCARPGVSDDQAGFGLSPAEFTVHLYVCYLAEVGNGGHSQFFANPSGDHATEVVEALATLGMADLHAILSEACAVFPGGTVPRNRQEREASISRLSPAALSRWDALDRRLYTVDRASAPKALAFLRSHAPEILTPERT